MADRLALVTSIAAQLMATTPATAPAVSERVLQTLVEQLNVDAGFLRHNDHEIRASKLVAEWPPRTDPPDPDPLAVVSFTTADPVFTTCAHGKRVAVIRPEPSESGYVRQLAIDHAIESLSVATAPLISGPVTTGMLGLVKFRRPKWRPEELNTIEAIASLFAQLQARVVAEERLRYLADHDDLTGLHNRRALVAHLSDRLVAGNPGPVGVFYIDLDRLKPINDYLGHAAGDWFIQDFARRLRAYAGNRTMTARIGGDEFVVIPDWPMSMASAETFADRLQGALRDKVEIQGHTVTSTVSVGVTVGLPGEDTSAGLLHRADEAVLAAKRGGGNQTVSSTDDMSLKSLFRKDIELHLQGKIDDESLLLYYQPEVDLWSGAIVAVEALVRWRHPTRGLLLPGSFISIAESANLADDLGRWVMRSACAEFSSWQANGVRTNATLRVNVSPVQLAARGFVQNVVDTVEEFGLRPGSLCLEITERAVVQNIETTRRTLAELREAGVQIAIDDFGTGYAVLSHLKDLPVDTLKIDTVFVRELGVNAGDLAIVRAIIALAEAFGLQVVAEGVETSAAALTLMRHGCHRAQGFLFSRPVPGAAAESMLASRWMAMPFLADSQALVI
ncbi:bifunctional diguanylate cyclase/phosphodiesterase [Mycobacterium novum]|uniref:Bifunctional diguanylate cyclase/phosphodiesterase n=3 Tax=Mycobacteriaceae TaxID=1762 RepID=A0A7I9Y7I0_MYCAL|nr:bifunctional diguanylate cyclase/phosphodiesterase [Mycobacterium novum]GFG84537.1 bifunctional diguanylate cyclase/phosphodiesterase [Mycolicibacter algericus]